MGLSAFFIIFHLLSSLTVKITRFIVPVNVSRIRFFSPLLTFLIPYIKLLADDCLVTCECFIAEAFGSLSFHF